MGNFLVRSLVLGLGLSMDASATSLANGLKYTNMTKRMMLGMAILFGMMQGIMPFIGYCIGHALIQWIGAYIPWIALGVLSLIGLNMIISSIQKEDNALKSISMKGLAVQGIVTSLDALSVGFTMAENTILNALISVGCISLVTMVLCYISVRLGCRFGKRLGSIAQVFGGLILIGVGIEIFLKGMGI